MDASQIEAVKKVSASKKLGRDDAETLLEGAKKLIVAKGKKVSRFEVGGALPDGAVDAMLGPTGNLRAPSVKLGKTVIVGFNQEVYEEILG